MALKVNNTTVVDNSRNIISVNNFNSSGISTLGQVAIVQNSSGISTITLDGNSGIGTFQGIRVGTAVTVDSRGSTGGITVSGIITATTYIGSGSSLTGLTGASAATYGSSTQSPQIVVDSTGRITSISNVAISGDGGGGSSTEGIGTAFSTDSTSILSIIYRTPRSFTIDDNTTVTVQSDAGSNNFAYTKLDQIIVGSGAVLDIFTGTTFQTNILNIFP